MLKKSMPILASFLILILFLGGCSKKSKDSSEKENVKILAIMSLSGEAKEFGQSSKNALELVSSQLKKKGIQIVYFDDENNKYKVINSLKAIINKEKIKAILLCTQSQCGEAASEIASENKITVINATANSSVVMNKGKNFIYTLCYNDQFEGESLAQFSYENLNAKRVAIIFNEDDSYSKEVAENYRNKFEKLGGAITTFVSYSENTADYSDMLNKVKSSSADILFLPDYYYNVQNIGEQARRLQVNSKLLGTAGWNSSGIINSNIFQGAYFTSEYFPQDTIPNTLEFKQKYIGMFKVLPDSRAALTYDAAQVLMTTFENPVIVDNPEKVNEKLEKLSLEGVTGTTSFDRDKETKKTAIIVQIQYNTVQVVNKILP